MPRTTAAANAAALPSVSSHQQMMLAYLEWLWNEQAAVSFALGYTKGVYSPVGTPVRSFHYPPDGSGPLMPPYTRAIAVMDAAGVDLGAVRRWARKLARQRLASSKLEAEQ